MTARGSIPFDWTEERRGELRRLWLDGVDIAEISHRLGVSHWAIVNARRRYGLQVRPASQARPAWEPEQIEDFKARWRAGEKTGALAKRFGFAHEASVSNVAGRLGLPLRNPRKRWTPLGTFPVTFRPGERRVVPRG